MSDILGITYTGANAVNPSDTTDDPSGPYCALYIGTASSSNVKIKLAAGDVVTFMNVLQGTILPMQCLRVFVTGTTASNIVGLKAPPIGGKSFTG